VSSTPFKATLAPNRGRRCLPKYQCDYGNRVVIEVSTAVSVRQVSSPKSRCPGVSKRLKLSPSCSKVMTAALTEIWHSRSIAIQSERARRRSPRALT